MTTLSLTLNTAAETRQFLTQKGFVKVGSKYAHGTWINDEDQQAIVRLTLYAGRTPTGHGECSVRYRITL